VKLQHPLWHYSSDETNIFVSTKSSSCHGHIGDARHPEEETLQIQNHAETMESLGNDRRDDLAYYEEGIVENVAGMTWSQILDHGSPPEEGVLETTKTYEMLSYQLQRWAFETSNANITLAERLEKSKGKYDGKGN
jgi:hypothetical protein